MPKTVQLSDEAYNTLAALKQPNESFSDTVLRLAASRKNPLLLLNLKKYKRVPGYDEWREKMRQVDIAEVERRFGVKQETRTKEDASDAVRP